MEINLEALGFSNEEIFSRIVDSAVEQLFKSYDYGEDGESVKLSSRFETTIRKQILDRIDERIQELGEKHILPIVDSMIENLALQKTNEWGEKKGEPVSFVQYMIGRAQAWIEEPVNFDGRTKAQDSYNWRASTTRISYLVDKHLQYNIEEAMKQALAEANKSFIGGIQQAVQISLKNVAEKIKLSVAVK